VLQYLYPTFTALLAWLLLAEPIGRRVGIAVALGWAGVVLVAQPAILWGSANPLPTLPVLIGIAGALCTALAYVSVRSLGNSEHPLVIVFYFPLVALPLSLPALLLQPVMPSARELLWLLGVGLFTQLGQLGLTQALTALPAAQATAISYVQVLLAGLWGWLIFGETSDASTIGGGLLVLAATLISLSRPAQPRPAQPRNGSG
jgi:drug/metabolite transporter (DMT)-like permease